ncbi:MAG TPA: hypothetical protein PLT57_09520, partial [Accumulibacter sp.]|nr:hypothetical protein [Accumulibacter sp.]
MSASGWPCYFPEGFFAIPAAEPLPRRLLFSPVPPPLETIPMPALVLIHGIDQQQWSADALEARWL